MRLQRVHVTNFRCIEDSTEFEVDPVTCLVGKNESGKTSLLQALYRMNPDKKEDSGYETERDYPRRFLSDYADRHPKAAARVIKTRWVLDKEDQEALQEVVGPAAKFTEVDVSRAFGQEGTTWDVEVDDSAVISYLLDDSGLHKEEKDALAGHKTIKELTAAVAALGNAATERHKALQATLTEHFSRGTASLAAVDVLWKRFPKFVYFSNYQRMAGRIALNALQKRQAGQDGGLTDGDKTFIDFCAFAGASVNELATVAKFESLVARFEAASNKITSNIFKYWSQNRSLRVQFSRDAAQPQDPAPYNQGNIFNVRIWNNLHQMSVPFDDRSAGFVWFFSFLVVFSQVKKTFGDRLVLLLDEPGLTLHGKAQADLLRFIAAELAPKHQVLYTTHSPFMVPHDKLLTVRTVEDTTVEIDGVVEVKGTKVGADVLSVSRDTLFPLQGALGYEIAQSLFLRKNTIVVEGPSDLLFLKAYSAHLQSMGKASLRIGWVVCPIGGVDKVPAFLALFGGNHLNVVVLVDVALGQKKKTAEVERLTEILKTGKVFTMTQYCGQQEADIEDLIGAQGYVDLVNEAYGLVGNNPITLPAGTPPARILKFVEEQMRLRHGLPDFDHYKPADHLIQNRAALLPKLTDSAKALGRFEALINDINTRFVAE